MYNAHQQFPAIDRGLTTGLNENYTGRMGSFASTLVPEAELEI